MKEINKCLGQVSKDQGCRGCTVVISIEKEIKNLNGKKGDEVATGTIISEWSRYCPEGMQPAFHKNDNSIKGGDSE